MFTQFKLSVNRARITHFRWWPSPLCIYVQDPHSAHKSRDIHICDSLSLVRTGSRSSSLRSGAAFKGFPRRFRHRTHITKRWTHKYASAEIDLVWPQTGRTISPDLNCWSLLGGGRRREATQWVGEVTYWVSAWCWRLLCRSVWVRVCRCAAHSVDHRSEDQDRIWNRERERVREKERRRLSDELRLIYGVKFHLAQYVGHS